MSDDEYFGDDDLFTSEVLDNIPALNQPPSPVIEASNLHNPPVQHPPPAVPSSVPGWSANNPIVVGPTNGAMRTPSSQRTVSEPQRTINSRFSTIMNALRTGGPTQQPGSRGVFGPQTGLLHPPNRKDRSISSQSSGFQSNVAGPSRIPSQSSPAAGLKRRRGSLPAQDSSLEAEIRTDTWSVMEEELTCAICCDVFVSPQITHCGHSACAPCLKIWLSKNNNCPICRAYINSNSVLAANRLASSMVDRMMAEATRYNLPGWCSGGTKEVEWKKRKRIWQGEVEREPAGPQTPHRTTTRSAAAARHRVHVARPLFLDDEDYDNYDYDDLGVLRRF